MDTLGFEGRGPSSGSPARASAAGSDASESSSGFPGLYNRSTPLPTLAEVIERIGMGPAQLKAGIAGGGVWLADGSELLLISSVTNSLAFDWQLSGFERGFVVTAVYMGILMGNLFSGPFADALGRRCLILLSYVGLFVMSMVSSCSFGFLSLVCTRLCVGVSIGLGQPSWNALGTELTPSSWRLVTNACGQLLFPLGEIYSALLLLADDPNLASLDWRSLLRYGAIPSAVLLCLSHCWLPESPSYLALKHRDYEAEAVLHHMARTNNRYVESVSFAPSLGRPQNSESLWTAIPKQVNIVFSSHLLGTTGIIVHSCFMLNFAYFGSLFAFPQVLPGVLHSSSAASELLVGALWELPGFCLGIFVGIQVARKVAIKTYLLLSSVAFFMFASAVTSGHHNYAAEVALRLGYYGIKCFVNIGFVVVYQYSVEVYPTEARTTGTAVNLAGGRLAAMLSPLVFEGIMEVGKGPAAYFWLIAAGLALNFFLIDFLPYETADSALHDSLQDLGREEEDCSFRSNLDLEKASSSSSSCRSSIASVGRYGATDLQTGSA